MSTERLQKLMAHAGIASRRHSEEIIKAGRVTVNGRVATLGDKANPRQDKITVDGRPLPRPQQKIYIMVNKPRDVISDEDDTGEGRTTVRDLINLPGHLYPVGRLDKQSMGLILMTNDGDLAHKLTHPRYGHKKVYRVKIEGNPTQEIIKEWQRGVWLEDEETRTAVAGVRVDKRTTDHTWLTVTLREGRKRQIRRVAAHLGHPVLHLSREQLGPLVLGDLELGKWRHLTGNEVKALHRAVRRPEERDGRSSRRPSTRKNSRRR